MNPLEHRCNPLESHARVHTRLGQGGENTLLVPVVLHEDQVPNFNVAISIALWRTRWTAPDSWPVVIEDFAAWTTGPGVGHLPEVIAGVAGTFVVPNPNNALNRDTDFLLPNSIGLVIVLIDRDPEPLLGQAIDIGEQGPGITNGILFEVITKREVAQHLEEGVVPRRVAHVL